MIYKENFCKLAIKTIELVGMNVKNLHTFTSRKSTHNVSTVKVRN